jgi:hypothetical protein
VEYLDIKQYQNAMNLWCSKKEPEKELTGGPPVPRKKRPANDTWLNTPFTSGWIGKGGMAG